jgi:hypothetical protein
VFNLDHHLRRDTLHRNNVIKYLQSPRDQICNAKVWRLFGAPDIAVATQIILRYQFFEQLVDAVGFPANSERTQYEVGDIERVGLPPKLIQVLAFLLTYAF